MKRTPLRRTARLKTRSRKQSLVKELDALVRQIVLLRDHGRCKRCDLPARAGRGGGLEAAHILPKGSYPALRHELLNVITLCHRCHFYWWHKDPIGAWEWILQRFGKPFVDELRMMSTRSKVDKKALKIYLALKLDKILKSREVF